MDYTRFEVARLIGARALQIQMGAPVFIKIPAEAKSPIEVAKIEFAQDVLPITVRRK